MWMLCANSTGTEKLKPLVISRARRHYDFGPHLNPDVLSSFYFNKKALMTMNIFDRCVKALITD